MLGCLSVVRGSVAVPQTVSVHGRVVFGAEQTLATTKVCRVEWGYMYDSSHSMRVLGPMVVALVTCQ